MTSIIKDVFVKKQIQLEETDVVNGFLFFTLKLID